ncbi:hypothetical protein BKA67DRAFT_140410 [Truncatella angustata]|uniref:Uncharacterized protein n=1 Tax=Truncatella angustata TaxID=152316 RepID=A0A9P8UAA5_9PEZI|nr:uncharacterized protein BKA67DRAFT_140410 [Truncatella angustata]KAH6640067.1 hypothetical protein BKA67DRAFT_140410 [Truncatella angustata]
MRIRLWLPAEWLVAKTSSRKKIKPATIISSLNWNRKVNWKSVTRQTLMTHTASNCQVSQITMRLCYAR